MQKLAKYTDEELISALADRNPYRLHGQVDRPNNEDRANWAGLCLRLFAAMTGLQGPDLVECAPGDLIANILHWRDRNPGKLLSFKAADALLLGEIHHEEELAEEIEELLDSAGLAVSSPLSDLSAALADEPLAYLDWVTGAHLDWVMSLDQGDRVIFTSSYENKSLDGAYVIQFIEQVDDDIWHVVFTDGTDIQVQPGELSAPTEVDEEEPCGV